MEDSKDTVFVQNIGQHAEGEEFIKLFKKIGPIKTNRHTGERLAIMKPNNGTKVGIVTFEDATKAQDAVKQLNGVFLGDSKIQVLTAMEMFKTLGTETVIHHDELHNTAWSLWTQRNFMRNRATPQEGHPIVKYPKGGAGGQGGDGWIGGIFRGQDGQPGENGPYGKGGEGGKGGCSVS